MLNETLEKFLHKYSSISGWEVQESSGIVWVGNQYFQIDPDFSRELQKILLSLVPWRKGPFGFGSPQNPILTLDAEWVSQKKWNVFLQKAQPDLYKKIILDLGCNNGYYLFRLLTQNPTELHGWDPCDLYKNQFDLLRGLSKENRIQFKKLGWQALPEFVKFFDVILCFGILYHHADPISMLSYIHQSLKNKGVLYLESLGIDESGSFALIPSKTYANAKGMWFIPTQNCLENLLTRCGFNNVKILDKRPLTIQEQRTTVYSPYPSLQEGMSTCLQKTIEGYPPPYRFLVQAQK